MTGQLPKTTGEWIDWWLGLEPHLTPDAKATSLVTRLADFSSKKGAVCPAVTLQDSDQGKNDSRAMCARSVAGDILDLAAVVASQHFQRPIKKVAYVGLSKSFNGEPTDEVMNALLEVGKGYGLATKKYMPCSYLFGLPADVDAAYNAKTHREFGLALGYPAEAVAAFRTPDGPAPLYNLQQTQARKTKKPTQQAAVKSPTRTVTMTTERDQFLAVSQLKGRGWTDALIARFLGDPDELRTNPRYRSGPPMRLYKMPRVEEVEASTEFCDAQDARKNRRDAAQKGLATKKQKIADYVETVEIKVPQLTKDELIRLACDNYNANIPEWKYDAPLATEHSDPTFLERICVNYLRHCLTKYETHLDEIAGKVGVLDAYTEIKEKVLEAIADEYDWLRKECSRQRKRM